MSAAIGNYLTYHIEVLDNNFSYTYSIASALTHAKEEQLQIEENSDSLQVIRPDCDRTDYALAACCGALCGIIDIFLVGAPGESPLGNISDEWFANRTKDFATLCHPDNKTFDTLESAIRFLGNKFKIPYDQTGLGDAGKVVFGLNPTNHHFKSLAHNPSLAGLFFSILDQFANTSHFVTNGQLISLQQAKDTWELQGSNVPGKLFCGFVNWFGHLVSDISGSESSARKGNRGMGIPSPLWTWTNDIIAIKAKLGLGVTETDKAINELTLTIFEKGYDTRFQTIQAIPVFINEMLVRFIYSVRRLFKYFAETEIESRTFSLMWKKCEPFSNPTVKQMLTVAHGTFCVIDAGDATIRSFTAGGGTFNPVEFILRLNIVGIGRFAISLYGEVKRGINTQRIEREVLFLRKQRSVLSYYIEGLETLAVLYDDRDLIGFVNDLKRDNQHVQAFQKTVTLAKKRNVPQSKIAKNKADIDAYFSKR